MTCSPSGNLVGFWTETAGGKRVYLADWQHRAYRPIATIPGLSGELIDLACEDSGAVYAWRRLYHGRRRIPSPVQRIVSGGSKSVGDFDQVITGRTATLGVRCSVTKSAITVVVTELNQRLDRKRTRYTLPLPLSPPVGVYNGLICSDDGMWWAVKLSETDANALVPGVNAALLVWSSAGRRAPFLLREQRLRPFIPVGLGLLPPGV